MAVSIGQQLGPYEIICLIGEGGMGKVYKAKDTRLDRIVAIKVLPDSTAASPEARQRFEREARAVSSLNHPNICALYDVGRQGGTDYLVMEYLEGQTLADRLKKGPLPLEQALDAGVQILSALECAHQGGVIHRDLKPGNIFLTASGPKVLDFGLAKIQRSQAAAAAAPDMATLTTPLTVEGVIAGTLQYMSPEQLEGKEADSRSDLFAFGAVLYETITGRRAFEAGSHAALISRIMSAEPGPVSAAQPLASPALDHIVRACLAKNPGDRWQSAHDLSVQLKWIASAGSEAGMPAPAVARRKSRERLAWSLAGALALAALALSFAHFREKPSEVYPVRFEVFLAPNTFLDAYEYPALSPDGRQLVFAASTQGRTSALWIRSLDTAIVRPVVGSEGAYHPFWSPDSRFIGFFADQKLKKTDLFGSPPVILCQTPPIIAGGTWSADGTILIASPFGPMQRVAAGGGDLKPALPLDKSRQESSQRWPWFLPDGRHFLYMSRTRSETTTEIRAGSLDSSETLSVMAATSNVAFSPPGFLLFGRDQTLMAQPFDAGKLRLTGDPFPIGSGVGRSGVIQRSFFSVSQTGAVAWRGVSAPDSQIAVYSRDGKRLGGVGEVQQIRSLALSPDGRRLAMERTDSKIGARPDIWVVDLASHIFSRVTTDPASDQDPVWSPDGRELVFSSRRKAATDLYRKVVGGAPERALLESDEAKYPEQWLADGSILFIGQRGKAFYRLPLEGERKPVVLFQDDSEKDEPNVSPDGRWIAYDSQESGRWEVYVASFPGFTERQQVSNSSGAQPQWRKDGKELYYTTLEGALMAVDIKPRSGPAGAGLEASVPREMFRIPTRIDPVLNQYGVTGDGSKFYVLENVQQGPEAMTILLNWTAGQAK